MKEFNEGCNLYLSRADVQKLLNVTHQALIKAIKSGRFRAILVNGNGGMQYRIALTSLPEQAQVRWVSAHPEEAINLPLELVQRLSKEAREEIVRLKAGNFEKSEEVYMIDHKDKEKVTYAIKQYLLEPSSKTVAKLAGELGVFPSTIYRWVKKAKESPKNTSYIEVQEQKVPVRLPRTSVPKEAILQSISIILSHHTRIKQGYDFLVKQGYGHLSYSQYTRILNNMEPSFKRLLKRSGRVSLLLADTPKIIRAWTELPVMNTIVGDQHYMDYYFWSEELQDTVKFTLYIWMDCTSRYYCSCVPAVGNYTQWHVQASLIEAFRIHTPDEIYTDWGKQETSRATEELIKRLGTGYLRIGNYDEFIDRYPDAEIKRKHSPPGVPPVKPIESAIRRLTNELNQRGLPGYMRRDLKDPFRSKEIQDELRRLGKKGGLLSAEVGMQALIDTINELNNRQIRTEEGATFIPSEYLWQGLEGRRVVWGEQELAMMFYPKEKRKVRNASVTVSISGKKIIFTAKELTWINDEEVVVFVNPFPPHEGSMIFREKRGELEYLCHAHTWIGYNVSPQDSETLKRAMEIKYSYLKEFVQAMREIHKYKVEPTKKVGEVSKLTKEVRKNAEVVMLPKVKKEDYSKQNWDALGKLADRLGY